MSVKEQFFNDNFNAHQNDFTLNNGNYEATFTRDVLDMVHDDANDGEYKNFEFNLVLNILIVFSELILSYTLGSKVFFHILPVDLIRF